MNNMLNKFNLKKVIIVTLMLLSCIFILISCDELDESPADISRFERLPYNDAVAGWSVKYYADKETDVVYICRGDGGISALFNADGSPVLRNEFIKSAKKYLKDND